MLWQDWVMAFTQLTFVVALIPIALGPSKPPLTASIPTASALIVMAGVLTTLQLWWTVATVTATAVLWSIIAWQRWQQIVTEPVPQQAEDR